MTALRIGSLFSGYGGLEMGVRAVLGGEVAWHSEIEPAAVKVLEHHHPGVPNLGDITTVDWSQVEPVDVLTAGFPCQDVSAAGRRLGLRPGTRSGLWSRTRDAIEALQPGLFVAENVRGLLSAEAHRPVEPCPYCVGDGSVPSLRALGAVAGDLSELGYVGRWVGVRASDIGAPHGRFRVFLAAWPATDSERLRLGAGWPAAPGEAAGGWSGGDLAGRGGLTSADSLGEGRRSRGRLGRSVGSAAVGDDPSTPAHAAGIGWREGRPEPARIVGGSDAALCGDVTSPDSAGTGGRQYESQHVGDDCSEAVRAGQAEPGRRDSAPAAASGDGCERDQERNGWQVGSGQQAPLGADTAGRVLDWGAYGPAIARWERALGRPAPTPTVTGKRGGQQLSPLFVEWLMGLPEGHVTAVPGLTRNEMLKLLGNGVVWQQAAAALPMLLTSTSERAA